MFAHIVIYFYRTVWDTWTDDLIKNQVFILLYMLGTANT